MTLPHEPLTVRRPDPSARLPLVCDSPHSGTIYPRDFDTIVPKSLLRQGEDTDVDVLWRAVPDVGGTLIAAHFPRSYIDPNRAIDDLDPAQLDGAWPTPLRPTEKSRLGIGLVWRQMGAENPMYTRPLTVTEVQARIATCWQPYQDRLQAEIDAAVTQFGGVWHLNLHSMPNNSYARLGLDPSRQLADFVLGDLDGTTCEPGLVDVVEQALRSGGYSVARNDPFKGVALLARIGQPARNRHSLQIEIRRPLYMDEGSRERNAGFPALQQHLTHTLQEVAGYVRSRLGIPRPGAGD